MAEIALPTHEQVQSVINNQLNSMEYHSIDTSVLTDQFTNPETVLEITGSGILLFVTKSMNDNIVMQISLTVDNSPLTSNIFVGGSHGSNATLMIPFNESLVVSAAREGTTNTSLGINYLLKI